MKFTRNCSSFCPLLSFIVNDEEGKSVGDERRSGKIFKEILKQKGYYTEGCMENSTVMGLLIVEEID